MGHLALTYGNHLNQERSKQWPKTNLNQITFDLSTYGSQLVGRRFEVQIELLDSFRRLHKSALISTVLITPEFYGHAVVKEEPSLVCDMPVTDATEEKLVNLVVVTQDKAEQATRKENEDDAWFVSEKVKQKLTLLR